MQAFVHKDQKEKRNGTMLDPNVSLGAGDITIPRNPPDSPVRGRSCCPRHTFLFHRKQDS